MFDKTLFKDILLIIILALITIAAVAWTTTYVRKDFEEYQNESLCVNHKIRQGHERRDIETGNGTCWIKSRI
jgi:capsular polysaccharide biosynthesis protein